VSAPALVVVIELEAEPRVLIDAADKEQEARLVDRLASSGQLVEVGARLLRLAWQYHKAGWDPGSKETDDETEADEQRLGSRGPRSARAT
jgi:hypothetical protein